MKELYLVVTWCFLVAAAYAALNEDMSWMWIFVFGSLLTISAMLKEDI